MGIGTATFWGSAAWVAYTYAGYPCLVWCLARWAPRPAKSGPFEPTISIVMAVRNGEREVGTKLENLRDLDYPTEKLQIIVVSDGSTDRTVEVVRGFSDRSVELVVIEVPSGKATALNEGTARARGELVVFCDTRQRIEPRALRALATRFADPEVGAVSGELMIEGGGGSSLYWQYEKLIRSAEGALDSVPGATGALYAIRRELFRDLPRDCLLDDVYTPMSIVLSGRRVVFEPTARAHDVEVGLRDEFQRKARTLAGNFQLLGQLPGLLDPRRNRILWQFASHKLARLACPYALAGMFVSSAALAALGGARRPLYATLLGAQLLAYGLAASGARRGERASRLERVAHTFVTLNVAAVEGLRRYLTGDLAWTTTRTRNC
jgi:biofilm PGA synthesis N-glycosyltransferase PgaC